MFFSLLRPNPTGQPTCVNAFLTPQECQTLISSGENDLELQIAKTEDHQIHESLRKSQISWFDPNGANAWLFNRIRDCINEVNAHWFGYRLDGFEGIQFTKYSCNKNQQGDFYSSHKDTVMLPGGTVRKLSFTIQLSDPETYEGGEVILYNSLIDCAPLSRATGSMSLFPSYTIHEVRPVTKGIRYSLVGWCCGPAFT
jgi:PKHD-type hydroxylase